MESVQALTSIAASTRVHERDAGKRRDPEAFRRALRDQAGDTAEAPAGDDDSAVRTGLQRRVGNGRRGEGATSRHVDVVA